MSEGKKGHGLVGLAVVLFVVLCVVERVQPGLVKQAGAEALGFVIQMLDQILGSEKPKRFHLDPKRYIRQD